MLLIANIPAVLISRSPLKMCQHHIFSVRNPNTGLILRIQMNIRLISQRVNLKCYTVQVKNVKRLHKYFTMSRLRLVCNVKLNGQFLPDSRHDLQYQLPSPVSRANFGESGKSCSA